MAVGSVYTVHSTHTELCSGMKSIVGSGYKYIGGYRYGSCELFLGSIIICL